MVCLFFFISEGPDIQDKNGDKSSGRKIWKKQNKFIWKLDEMHKKKIKLQGAIDNPKNVGLKKDLLELYYDLDKEFTLYIEYLTVNQ